MIKVYFKEITYHYDNGCSCCEPMEVTEYWYSHSEGEISYWQGQHLEDLGGCSEQYRCLVDTSYILSESSLSYHEYVDWCYNLFNYEQMEELLKSDKIEVVFISEEDDA